MDHNQLPGLKVSLPPREAWIEIYFSYSFLKRLIGRFPRGKRGLKCHLYGTAPAARESLPPREAWIEILHLPYRKTPAQVASPAGSVD